MEGAMNGQQFPPDAQGLPGQMARPSPIIGLTDMIQIRMALQEFKPPKPKELNDAIIKIDKIIANIINGFQPAPTESN